MKSRIRIAFCLFIEIVINKIHIIMDKELLKELELDGKTPQIKKKIIAYLVENGNATITALSKSLRLSVPTVTKLILDMMSVGSLKDYGKLETAGGRHPILYGLNPESGYFIGVDVKHDYINIGMIDFVGNMQKNTNNIPFVLENTVESMDKLCHIISAFVDDLEQSKREILNVNVNLPGRINPKKGYSYTFFNFDESRSLAEVLSEKLGMRVSIDNDTRGMAFGEYTQGYASENNIKNMLYINVSWGIGLGLILDGRIYMGKSGYSGEFGHVSSYDNQILCHCGKKGCLETEVSGSAVHRELTTRIKNGESSILSKKVESGQDITLDDIISAANHEDILSLEVLCEMGRKLGKQVAGLINIFNPELIVVGGSLSLTGEYIKEAIQSIVRTYSLNLVNKDTEIMTATLGDKAGVIGACMLARSRRFDSD